MPRLHSKSVFEQFEEQDELYEEGLSDEDQALLDAVEEEYRDRMILEQYEEDRQEDDLDRWGEYGGYLDYDDYHGNY